MNPKALGQQAKEYRLKANMTQLELATKLGYESMQFVSLFERGISKIPLNTLGKLIVILGMPEKAIKKSIVSDFENEINQEIEIGKNSLLIN